MALLLFRLGRAAYRAPWRVILAWLVLLGAALGAGLGLGGQMRESFSIPGTESQQALDRLSSVFPQVSGGSAQVVIVAPEGERIDSPASRALVEDTATRLGALDGVAQALSPFSEYATDAIAADGEVATTQLQFDAESSAIPESLLEEAQAIGSEIEADGYRVEFGGQPFQAIEYGLTVTEVIGVLFAGVVLVITFGSFLAAGMPLAAAIAGVAVTMGLMLAAATLVDISSATPLLAVMIGLAVGIDYALFIISRHRHQLAGGMAAEESAATAVGTAGSAVIFAGVTVMIALLGLMIVGIPFLSVMGIAAAVAVLAAMGTAVTLVPALLGLAGERMRPKAGSRAERRERAGDDAPTMGRRWVGLVLKAPWLFIVLVVGILGAIAVPAASLQLALPTAAGQPSGTTAREAYDLIEEHWGPGRNGPFLVMMDITQASNDTLMDDLASIRDEVAAVPGVATTGDALPNPTVDSAILQVIPTTAPDDPATTDTVNAIRALADSIRERTGIEIAVTGATAVAIDVSDRLDGALVPFALVVVGLSFVLLAMVFRSILVPLKAALSFLLSVLAAFGVVVAIFQWGWLSEALGVVPGPIISFMPVLLMAIVFGLSMDYEVFLVSGMREAAVYGDAPRQAVIHGFTRAARVVTAAALIMFFVFAAFVPEGAGVIKAIALGLAAGIAFDAFLVRMTLVPAIMAILGKSAWWLPTWLDKRLPNLDIEGESLRHHLDAANWAQGDAAAVALDRLEAGDERMPVPAASGSAPAGGVLLLAGTPLERRILAATIAGRLPARGGRLRVGDLVVPGDGPAILRRVALAELGAADDRTVGLALGELLRLRGRLGSGARTPDDRQVDDAIAGLRETLGRLGVPAPALSAATPLDRLDPLGRALALGLAALAEGPEVLIVELGGAVPEAGGQDLAARLVDGLAELAPAETTLIVAGTDPALAALGADGAVRGRPVSRIAVDRAGAAGEAPRAATAIVPEPVGAPWEPAPLPAYAAQAYAASTAPLATPPSGPAWTPGPLPEPTLPTDSATRKDHR